MGSESSSERRLAENEVMFRQANQKVQKSLEELDKNVVAAGHPSLMLTADIPLHFYCECSNEKCRKRIKVTPKQYEELHQNSSQFIIIPGHQVATIEKTIHVTPDYMVVEKYQTPPKKADKLRRTNL